MKVIGHLISFDHNVWQNGIAISDEDAQKMVAQKVERWEVKVNGINHGNCSIMKDKGGHFILTNKEKMKACNIKMDVDLILEFEPNLSKLGVEHPDCLLQVFDSNPEVKSYFEKLTPGKQRALIYIVAKVKSPEAKMKKAMAIGHHLIEEKGVLDFKLLNEMIKKYNKGFV